MYSHQCSTIAGGPNPARVQEVLLGLRQTDDPDEWDFSDRLGRGIHIPRDTRGRVSRPWFADGYAQALWDFRIGSMLLGDDGVTLYVRDTCRDGRNELLASWHAISSLEEEYDVPRGQRFPSWNDQLRTECRKLDKRVKHGVKFTNYAFLRVDGKVQCLTSDRVEFDQPYELTFNVPFDEKLAKTAFHFLRDVTDEEHSARNLCRMFATPLLEPYKHLSYVLYGDGGNGKGILLGALAGSFPELAKPVDAQTLLGGRRGQGGFSSDQEASKLLGTLWVYDDDADTITIDQMTALKKISTGDMIRSRKIQQDSVDVKPRCTFIIATNNPVITTMTAASARRFAYVRMKDGRKSTDFLPLLAFRAEYGVAPFVMSSCMEWWSNGDEPYRDIVIGGHADLSEAEQWIVDEIVASGYAVSGLNPYRENATDHKNSINKLGLKSSMKRVDGHSVRVLTVADEQRFAPYRAESESSYETAGVVAVAAAPAPIDFAVEGQPAPSEYGFDCDYVPAGADKKAINWKKRVEDPQADTSVRPDSPAYGVVPSEGCMVLDMDRSKDDGKAGWDIVSEQVGAYGSADFPSTYLVKTPSGGYHAYYRLPESLRGKLKNAAHPNGLPVDTRVERKGYVIGAGSVTDAGRYEVCDVPEHGVIPTIPLRMVNWLEEHDYVEGCEPRPARPVVAVRKPSGRRSMGRPDMSPVPEGQRNDTLHSWAYGRLKNYPEDKDRIMSDLFDRARISGLAESEAATIWKSVCRQLGA